MLRFQERWRSQKESSQMRSDRNLYEAQTRNQQHRGCGNYTCVVGPMGIDAQSKILASLRATVLGPRRGAMGYRYIAATGNSFEMTVITRSKAQHGILRDHGARQ